jgi:hypothetical protein
MIDGHCHLDKKRGSPQESLAYLFEQAKAAKVQGVVILNLLESGHSNDEVLAASKFYGSFFHFFPTLLPAAPKACHELRRLKDLGVSGLKLHPRLDNYFILSPECIEIVKAAGDLDMPVLIDAFPWGRNFVLGNVPEAFARLAEAAPHTRIAIGHSGGHRVLDALMVAKYYKNIYLDFTLTLLYYRGSTVLQDMKYAVSCLRGDRIFLGTDYPDREYQDSILFTRQEIDSWDLSDEYRKKICTENIKHFLGKKKSEG